MMDLQQVEVGDDAPRTSVAPFQVRGRFFTAVVLQMARGPDESFYTAIDVMLAQTPHFFANAPFVLDLDRIAETGPLIDFIALTRELRNRKITLIGVQNGTIAQNRAALHAGLITLPSGTEMLPDRGKRNGAAKATANEDDAPKPAPARTGSANREAPFSEPAGDPSPGAAAVIVTEPVRSGQRIVAERGDLVVIASVSPGAELIARGNIHVYGPLRGRALAGVNGNNAARIFCQSLEAELIAIAGIYQPSDAIAPSLRGGRVQAFLDSGRLRVEPLK
jgi:septum site-determining protein MinC